MVPHTWIFKCLNMVGKARNIELISSSMTNCKALLISVGREPWQQVGIKRGIFEGDSLSPLLFLLIMQPLTLILRKMKAEYRLPKSMTLINRFLFLDHYDPNRNQLNPFSRQSENSLRTPKCHLNWMSVQC